MRPLNITIAGFGTYCETTKIDFSKLGSEGLYLITGDTGSGKTTIFDAITFALYGEASGTNKDDTMLRSSFAGKKDKTFVELEFEFHDKIYFIKRSPKYEIKNDGKKEPTVKNPTAELILPDKTVISGKKNVDNKIEEILGINKSQFRQIAMIAQGDFQKLLFEKSENRQLFFRKLFKTENYQKLQDLLKAKVKELKDSFEKTSNLLNNEIKAVNCDNNSELCEKLENAKTIALPWNEKADIIQAIIEEDNTSNDNIKNIKDKLSSELDDIKIKISEITRLNEDRKQAEKLEKNILAKESLINQLKETVQIKKEVLDESAKKEEEKTLIANDLDKYDRLDEKVGDLSSLKEKITSIQEDVSLSSVTIEEKECKIKQLENELTELKDAVVNHQQYLTEKEKLTERITSLNELNDRFLQLEKLCETSAAAKEDYIKASENYEKAYNSYFEKNKAFLDGQAGILASRLEENKPCPVCGSLIHPNLCKKADVVPSEEELNKAKDDSEKLEKIASEKSEFVSTINAEYNAKKEEVNSVFHKLFSHDTDADAQKVTDEIKASENELEAVKARLKEESSKIERKDTIEKKLPDIKEELKAEKEVQTENNNNLIKIRAEAESLEKQIIELRNQLVFESKKDANSRLTKLEREIDFAKKTYKDAMEKFNGENIKLTELKTSLSALNKNINNSNIKNESEIEDKYNELSEKIENITKDEDVIKARIVVNKKVLEVINEKIDDMEKTEKAFNTINSLSATANGSIGEGHQKVQLETYIQMAFFDKILAHANTRLLIMSDEQYELVRVKESSNLKSKTGLDLNVIDHYNGTERSVKSLSGGECFQASLALALGLSDEVTSSAGGIKIDSMFVDEGFGTLDSETIQKAYKALVSVTQGNKLVGIISHVDYLKDKIEKQIVVTKTRNNGSFVTINA